MSVAKSPKSVPRPEELRRCAPAGHRSCRQTLRQRARRWVKEHIQIDNGKIAEYQVEMMSLRTATTSLGFRLWWDRLGRALLSVRPHP